MLVHFRRKKAPLWRLCVLGRHNHQEGILLWMFWVQRGRFSFKGDHFVKTHIKCALVTHDTFTSHSFACLYTYIYIICTLKLYLVETIFFFLLFRSTNEWIDIVDDFVLCRKKSARIRKWVHKHILYIYIYKRSNKKQMLLITSQSFE